MKHFEDIFLDFRLFLKERFDVRKEKSDDVATIEAIRRGIEFKGINLWVLILAIFIASLGLNTNSTAVIIGAMLISPLMGPIMGVGLGLGINDVELLNKSLKNLAVATIFGVLTAAIYFLISPMSDARSELLARTQPTIYDVLIAFFGGMAGIVAGSAREKGNVIPGVAIATALMPPLCTAGYGLATGNMAFFFGAFYLYFINSVFISLATYVGVRIMHFPKIAFMDPERAKRVSRTISFVVVLTIIPSLWISYNMIRQNYFEGNAVNFIRHELNFPGTQVVNQTIDAGKEKKIHVALIGQTVSAESLELSRAKMNQYKIGDAELIISQNGSEVSDIKSLRALVLEDLYKNIENRLRDKEHQVDYLEGRLSEYTNILSKSSEIAPEIKVLFPSVQALTLSTGIQYGVQSSTSDTITIACLQMNNKPDETTRLRIEEWLKSRTKSKLFKLIIE
ncbi:MAG: TIGR00341 family protein [Bacteroidales bacterium]